MLDGIQELSGAQELHPGGHNWPDMQIVVDPSQTEVVDGGIYLICIQGSSPVVKALKNQGSSFRLMPALSTIHGHSSAMLFGRKVPVQTIEFTDIIYKHAVAVLGRVVGLWAGPIPDRAAEERG